MNEEASQRRHGSGTGVRVFALLAVLTAVEFTIAREVAANLQPLVAIALVKAGLILWYFMHVARAWRGHEEA